MTIHPGQEIYIGTVDESNIDTALMEKKYKRMTRAIKENMEYPPKWQGVLSAMNKLSASGQLNKQGSIKYESIQLSKFKGGKWQRTSLHSIANGIGIPIQDLLKLNPAISEKYFNDLDFSYMEGAWLNLPMGFGTKFQEKFPKISSSKIRKVS